MAFAAVGVWVCHGRSQAKPTAALDRLKTVVDGESAVIQVNASTTVNLERGSAAAYVFFAYTDRRSPQRACSQVSSHEATSTQAREDGRFSFLGQQGAGFNRDCSAAHGSPSAVWSARLRHGSIWHFNPADYRHDQLGVTTEAPGYHGYLGYWSAFSHRGRRPHRRRHGRRALVHPSLRSLGSMWTLCIRSQRGLRPAFGTTKTSTAPRGALIWLAITFFLGVGVYTIGNHERYGGWANSEASTSRLRRVALLRAHGVGYDGR